MRELKFRAWHNNKMCHFDLFTTEWDAMSIKDVIINAEPIMQFTGLLDKQGKEIYEGDIVSRFGKDIHKNKIENRYPVCFGLYDNGESYEDCVEGNGWYLGQELFFRSGIREAGGWENKCEHFNRPDGLEVIGNIYESEVKDGS